MPGVAPKNPLPVSPGNLRAGKTNVPSPLVANSTLPSPDRRLKSSPSPKSPKAPKSPKSSKTVFRFDGYPQAQSASLPSPSRKQSQTQLQSRSPLRGMTASATEELASQRLTPPRVPKKKHDVTDALADAEAVRVQKENETLEQELHKVVHERNAGERQIGLLRSDIEFLKEELSGAQSKRRSIAKFASKAREDYRCVEGKLLAIEIAKSTHVTGLEMNTEESDTLVMLIADLKGEAESLQSQLSVENKSRSLVTAEHAGMLSELQRLQSKTNQTKQEIRALSKEIKVAEFDHGHAALKAAESERDKFLTRFGNNKREADNLKRVVDTGLDQKRALSQSVSQLEDEIVSLRGSLQDASLEHRRMEDTLFQLSRSIAASEKQKAVLIDETNHLKTIRTRYKERCEPMDKHPALPCISPQTATQACQAEEEENCTNQSSSPAVSPRSQASLVDANLAEEADSNSVGSEADAY
eukprot:TRINITY_DN63622_c0_g1_i1.p1 TRINITY_DN63622_c0_g1~~TRINITY_DN63622_c0_g1_i1.p1  ORF type:complete len:470 (+),score=88.42 TRINITY_DN63622_c0_g1_i1:84-1493(+)